SYFTISFNFFQYFICFHIFFFFNAPPSPYIYTLSLHDAFPISRADSGQGDPAQEPADGAAGEVQEIAAYLLGRQRTAEGGRGRRDRKSTRLNSSHVAISYAVFCLKKKILIIY